MLSIALFSAVIWVTVMLLARYEFSHGVRLGGTIRRRVDRRLVHLGRGARGLAEYTVEFVKRDLVAQALHIVSYVALLSVRWIERKLVRVNELLRLFRKGRSGQHAERHRSLTETPPEDADTVR